MLQGAWRFCRNLIALLAIAYRVVSADTRRLTLFVATLRERPAEWGDECFASAN